MYGPPFQAEYTNRCAQMCDDPQLPSRNGCRIATRSTAPSPSLSYALKSITESARASSSWMKSPVWSVAGLSPLFVPSYQVLALSALNQPTTSPVTVSMPFDISV